MKSGPTTLLMLPIYLVKSRCARNLSSNKVTDRSFSEYYPKVVAGYQYTPSYMSSATASLYFTSRAMLTKTVDLTIRGNARSIYSSPGTTIIKPSVSTAGMVAISAMMFL